MITCHSSERQDKDINPPKYFIGAYAQKITIFSAPPQCHKTDENEGKKHPQPSHAGSENGMKIPPSHRSINPDYAEIRNIDDEMLCKPKAESSLLELC